MVACKDKEEVNRLYNALIHGGQELMPLDAYPFSPWYAWIEDRYGLSWQIMLTENYEATPRIRPSLLFAKEALGKAQDFMNDMLLLFNSSKKGEISYYESGESEITDAKVKYGELTLEGFPLVVMDHGKGGDFTFNEAFSFIIYCKDQDEIDYYWDKLSFAPEAEQCGWIKDKYGISWQIVPTEMMALLSNGTEEEIQRITRAFLQMKKFDLERIRRAKSGE